LGRAKSEFPSAIHQPFGMLAPVVFRDEAIPAHWKEILKNGGQIFRRNFAPLRSVAVRAKKSGLPDMPVDFMEGLLAIGTGPCPLPIVDHASDQATFRVGFNLRKAFLSTIRSGQRGH